MSNRTSYKFVLDESRKDCGILDAPLRELGTGTNEKPAELCIRGYKKTLALVGVTYTLQFRILEATDKDTNYRLNVFLSIGNIRTNIFGWYICKNNERILSPDEWRNRLKPQDGYNRDKGNFQDRVLNEGGKYHLRASCNELKLEIEMLTDDGWSATPSMIIRSTAQIQC
jgi:hypothetical protein